MGIILIVSHNGNEEFSRFKRQMDSWTQEKKLLEQPFLCYCLRNPPVSQSVYNKHQYDLYTHIFKLIIVLGHGCFSNIRQKVISLHARELLFVTHLLMTILLHST